MQYFSDPSRIEDAYLRPQTAPQTQSNVYGNLVYANTGYVNLPAMPAIPPPPPYDPYLDSYDYGQQSSRAFYLQPYQTQQYLPPPLPPAGQDGDGRLRKKASAWMSKVDLSRQQRNEVSGQQQLWQSSVTAAAPTLPQRPTASNDCPLVQLVQTVNQGAAMCDRLASVAAIVSDVFAKIDIDDDRTDSELEKMTKNMTVNERKIDDKALGSGWVDFRKTWLYANSRLPPAMLPMKIYMPTWQIICMAAQASVDVYRRPRRDEREDYVQADWRQGTKAMAIKSRQVEDKNLIVLAIRGSKTWNAIDWLVNFNAAPTEPIGFLDDEGNACHAGFLQIARSMIAPVAARLRKLLEENNSRNPPSLILTGHSAGGAVASLLYMHMLATAARCESELNDLSGFLKRIHCVTFGTPPVSLLPLQNPAGKRYERNVFMHFANEGDVVVRADRSYMSTIVRLVAAPSPVCSTKMCATVRKKVSKQVLSSSGYRPGNKYQPPRWEVPPATLSNAGRTIMLREKPGSKRHSVEAVQVTDEDLRDVVFGDPEMHKMELYKKRIDMLAIAAVTGQGVG
ncbi:hypothetical protein AC579_4862 [Pseudocercospora musae]|uniref:Fungal lipase-type domain-containing protein n=1 Tax=Pseudocercospora musae TaxID=113226 RepID=A0A139IKF8_9PEZI|nr:hypothetical protein AC579_4862 [Pseudocercospora musae]